ncbi:MAG TPA: dihydropteroate synthase, partial [Acidimicrobiales bacterium]|nr:dihydropteroate synthase [Acidimicrobiales bacterium]
EFDVTERAMVMAILNRTPDSFSEKGKYFGFDELLRRAEEVVTQGADILDVGGVKAGPGPEVSQAEEMDRVVPVVAALVERFDAPVSVDTWNSSVAEESFRKGAILGNDISGFSDPDYLRVAAKYGAGVVATHIRLFPRVPDPEPVYVDVVTEVSSRLCELAGKALAAGIAPESIVVDAGLDLGKTSEQSLQLFRMTGELAALGYPLLLSASNKTFLGDLLGLEVHQRKGASLAAATVGVCLGARVLRVHDVLGTRRACDALERLIQEGAQ